MTIIAPTILTTCVRANTLPLKVDTPEHTHIRMHARAHIHTQLINHEVMHRKETQNPHTPHVQSKFPSLPSTGPFAHANDFQSINERKQVCSAFPSPPILPALSGCVR